MSLYSYSNDYDGISYIYSLHKVYVKYKSMRYIYR